MVFVFSAHKGGEVSTIKMAEEDFEVRAWPQLFVAFHRHCIFPSPPPPLRMSHPLHKQMLEDNQVLVQGMMANRYMATFRDQISSWAKRLMGVSDVVSITADVQRSWNYLEGLFIASEEVKRELPEAAAKFAKVDGEVRQVSRACAALSLGQCATLGGGGSER